MGMYLFQPIAGGIVNKIAYNQIPKSHEQLERCQSRSQSFVPLDQRSENESSRSDHYEKTKEITEFWLSGSLRICIYGTCLKWLLPDLSFSDRWSRGTKLWKRDWNGAN